MKKAFIIFTSLFLINSFCYAGGGWTQKKNNGYFKLSQWWINSGKFYNRDAQIVGIPKTSVFVSSLYGEFGLSDNLTATTYVPFYVNSRSQNPNSTGSEDYIQGVGDLNIGLKYGLFQNRSIVMAIGVELGIPTGQFNGGDLGQLQTGDGDFNQLITVEASHSFYPVPIYLSTRIGFNNRTNNFSDEFRYSLEAGYTWKDLTIILRMDGLSSFFNGDENKEQALGIFNNNTEYLAYAAELVYQPFKRLGFTAGTASAFQGRNILAARTYNGGIFYKL